MALSKIIILSILLNIAYQYKKQYKKDSQEEKLQNVQQFFEIFHQQEQNNQNTHPYVDWTCVQQELSVYQCMSLADNQDYLDFQVYSVYMENYAINSTQLKEGQKCFIDHDIYFWQCVTKAFKPCVQKDGAIDQIGNLYPAYKKLPQIPQYMYGSSCFCEMDLSDINKNYDIFEYIDKNVTVGDYPSFLGYLQQNYTSDSSFYKCVYDSIEKDQIMEYFPPNFSDLNDKCADLVQNQQQILEWNTYSYDTTNKTTCSELRSIVKNSITQKKDPKLYQCIIEILDVQCAPIEKFRYPFDLLNKCATDIDRNAKDAYFQINSFNQLAEYSTENCSNWEQFDNYFHKTYPKSAQNTTVLKCIEQNLVNIKSFEYPFEKLNNCAQFINYTQIEQINTYNSIVQTADNSDKKWVNLAKSFYSEYSQYNYEYITCIEGYLPEVLQFKGGFSPLNKCQSKLDLQNVGDLEYSNKIIKDTEQMDWREFKQYLNQHKNSTSSFYQCLEQTAPEIDSFPGKYKEINEKCQQYLNFTDLNKIQQQNEMAKSAENSKNWDDFISKIDKYKGGDLYKCIRQVQYEQNKKNLQQFQTPFQSLNKCNNQLNFYNSTECDIYDKIVENSRIYNNWVDFELNQNKTIQSNVNNNSPVFECLNQTMPEILHFDGIFSSLDQECFKKIDSKNENNLQEYSEIVEISEQKNATWITFSVELQQKFENSSYASTQCILQNTPKIEVFSPPFESLNECSQFMNPNNQTEIKNYDQIVEKSKSFQNKQQLFDYLQSYDQFNNDKLKQCLLKNSISKFQKPFEILNECQDKIQISDEKQLQEFSNYTQIASQSENWVDIKQNFQKLIKENNYNDALTNCLLSKIPEVEKFPAQFEKLNKCQDPKIMDLKSLVEIQDSNDLIAEIKNDKQWKEFCRNFEKLQLKTGFPDDAYFQCIKREIPYPEIGKFKAPFESLNKCENELDMQCYDQRGFYSYFQDMSYQQDDWESLYKIYIQSNFTVQEVQQYPVFQCILRNIPIINYFQNIFKGLNDKCVNRYLNKASKQQILDLDVVSNYSFELKTNYTNESAQNDTENMYIYGKQIYLNDNNQYNKKKENQVDQVNQVNQESFSILLIHQHNSQNQTTNNNSINNNYENPVLNPVQLNYTEVDENYPLSENQEAWQKLAEFAQKEQKQGKIDLDGELINCIEIESYKQILSFREEFRELDQCLEYLDTQNRDDIERVKYLQENTQNATSYNEVKTEFVNENLNYYKEKMFECFKAVLDKVASNKKAVASGMALYLTFII